MIDRKTKVLLLVIGLGLWANVAVQVLRPSYLYAEGTTALSRTPNDDLANILTEVRRIGLGLCLNGKIC